VTGDIVYDRVYGFDVGGIHVVFGRTGQKEASGPVIYGAALSEQELRRYECGYGGTEAEAVVDLFRMMRPPRFGGI
jgi:hypothetical protein